MIAQAGQTGEGARAPFSTFLRMSSRRAHSLDKASAPVEISRLSLRSSELARRKCANSGPRSELARLNAPRCQ